MTARRDPRMHAPFRGGWRAVRTDSPWAERLLNELGAHPAFADAVLGDLAEERVRLEEQNGSFAARWWYAREAFRSAPHLMWNAMGHGGQRGRARVAALLALVALVPTAALIASLVRNGPPARLVVGVGDVAYGIVVNNVRPVQLEMQVLDKAGHLLKSHGVRYQWTSGAPIAISPLGVVTCTQDGDATVRASLGPIATDVAVRCRPVQEVQTTSWIDFVAGDPARHLPFKAIGVDGRPVTQLRGSARVVDSSVATLVGSSIRPRAVGETAVDVFVGDRSAHIQVIVHDLVRTLEGLHSNQRLVAVSVHLARGDTAQWALPKGVFWLKYLPRRAGEPPPTITVGGAIACTPGDGMRVYRLPLEEFGTYCLVRPAGATVTLAHGWTGALVVEGSLAIERVEYK